LTPFYDVFAVYTVKLAFTVTIKLEVTRCKRQIQKPPDKIFMLFYSNKKWLHSQRSLNVYPPS